MPWWALRPGRQLNFCVVSALLGFGGTLSAQAEGGAVSLGRSYAEQLAHWTPAQARASCAALASLAVRRASVVGLTFTRPAQHRADTWTLAGVAVLRDAPGGLRSAPFTCTFTAASDIFKMMPASLTFGP